MNENAKKWVAALRSGKYNQTKQVLTKIDKHGLKLGHCCLGVACELASADGVPLKVTEERLINGGVVRYDDQVGSLPEKVKNWLGLRSSMGMYKDCYYLVFDNDMGNKTFDQIADIIESEPEGLFAK